MLDYSKYKNLRFFPNKREILTDLVEELDELPLTKAEYDSRLEETKKIAATLHSEEMQKYNAETARLNQLFWNDVWELEGSTDSRNNELSVKVKVAIEERAWERGHSAGLSDVYNCFTDELCFVRTILEAIQ